MTPALSQAWSPVGKLGALAAVAFRQSLAERATLAGRMAFYAIILLIFSRLWWVVMEQGALAGRSPRDLVWYLAITEWVILSIPHIQLDIEADVRSGDLAYRLPRPIGYVTARLAEAAGDMGARLLALAVAGVTLAWALTGGPPGDARGLLLAVPLGVAAACTGLAFQAGIGLSAFWLQDASPVYWIWQKCAFIFGGLMLPLEIYPGWLRAVAAWTPFSAMMYGPGRLAFGLDLGHAAEVALKLGAWGAIAALALVWLYGRALRGLEVNGG